MQDNAVVVEHLSKSFRRGATVPYKSLRDAIGNIPARTRRIFTREPAVQADNDFFAINDLSFSIKKGSAIGLVGGNGAGKSTLLKILSRITQPSSGRAFVRGNVGTLLEVGTGFHPELTGAENIYLNGAILGMKHSEVKRKYEDIVEFSEIKDYVESPVKYYSSGMYVRLAFAVAAHMDPDILFVDEVLSVGDSAFQRKSLEKMNEVATTGNTIILVSHNMAAIRSLCSEGIVLSAGGLHYQGGIDTAVEEYLSLQTRATESSLKSRTDRSGTGRVKVESLQVTDVEEVDVTGTTTVKLKIKIDYKAESKIRGFRCVVGIYDPLNVPVLRLDTASQRNFPELMPAEGSLECVTGPVQLTAGTLYTNLAIFTGRELADHVVRATTFNFENIVAYETGLTFDRHDSLMMIGHKWTVL